MAARFGFMWTATTRKEKASTSLRREIGSFVSSRTASCTRSFQRPRIGGPLLYGSWATTPSARRIGLVLGFGRRTFRLVKFLLFIMINVTTSQTTRAPGGGGAYSLDFLRAM